MAVLSQRLVPVGLGAALDRGADVRIQRTATPSIRPVESGGSCRPERGKGPAGWRRGPYGNTYKMLRIKHLEGHSPEVRVLRPEWISFRPQTSPSAAGRAPRHRGK